MPSQMVTTFGSYATAPTQIVLLMIAVSPEFIPAEKGAFGHADFAPAHCLLLLRSEERHSENHPRNELAKHVAGWRHHRTCMSIPKQSLDVHVLRECRAAAHPHRRRSN